MSVPILIMNTQILGMSIRNTNINILPIWAQITILVILGISLLMLIGYLIFLIIDF